MNNLLVEFILDFGVDVPREMYSLWEAGEKAKPKPKPKPKAKPKKKGQSDEVTKTGYQKDIRGDNVIQTINPVSTPYPNFTEFQPAIQRFAFANPENMAATIIFVIATQQKQWPEVTELFPQMMEYIRKPVDFNGNRKSGVRPYPEGVAWGHLVVYGAPQVDAVWTYRRQIYDTITKAYEEDKQKGDTGFFVYKKMLAVPGLGFPKAGFATQLIIGKTGCIDSINLRVTGAPTDLMKGKSFRLPKPYIKVPKDKEDLDMAQLLFGALSKSGEEMAEQYVGYLEKLKRDGMSSPAQQLWDDWCEIVEYKIWHAGKKGVISIEDPERPETNTKVPVYWTNMSKQGGQADRIRANRRDIAQDQGVSIDDPKPRLSGVTVGRQHRDTIMNASQETIVRADTILEDSALTTAVFLLQESPEHKTLKDNQVDLEDEEREKAMKAGVTWNHGWKDGKQVPTCALKKSVVKGVTWYWTATHRCYQADKTIAAAIKSYHDVVEPSA